MGKGRLQNYEVLQQPLPPSKEGGSSKTRLKTSKKPCYTGENEPNLNGFKEGVGRSLQYDKHLP